MTAFCEGVDIARPGQIILSKVAPSLEPGPQWPSHGLTGPLLMASHIQSQSSPLDRRVSAMEVKT